MAPNPIWLTTPDRSIPLRTENVEKIGVTAGASAPEILVHEVLVRLARNHLKSIENLQGAEEHVTFALPRALRE